MKCSWRDIASWLVVAAYFLAAFIVAAFMLYALTTGIIWLVDKTAY